MNSCRTDRGMCAQSSLPGHESRLQLMNKLLLVFRVTPHIPWYISLLLTSNFWHPAFSLRKKAKHTQTRCLKIGWCSWISFTRHSADAGLRGWAEVLTWKGSNGRDPDAFLGQQQPPEHRHHGTKHVAGTTQCHSPSLPRVAHQVSRWKDYDNFRMEKNREMGNL